MKPDMEKFGKVEAVTLADLHGIMKKLAVWEDALPRGAINNHAC